MDLFSEKYARSIDRDDPLKEFRSQFEIPDDKVIYLDGNSLGRLPTGVTERLHEASSQEWGNRLIRSWNEGWYRKSTDLGSKIAGITGASADEVIVTDSTSVNLYKLAYAALRYNPARKKIITDDLNFPSDIYVLQGLIKEFGDEYDLQIIPLSGNENGVSLQQIEDVLDDNTALVTLSHVVFKSAFMYPMKEVSDLAHKYGALVLWDLSHSCGAVEVELNTSAADLAVGCTYKYLNGGPGAPAFLYVRKNLQDKLESPVWGWFGEDQPFRFGLEYTPAKGIRRFLAGTPPVLSLVPLEISLDIITRAGMPAIREKSIRQTEYLRSLAEYYLFRLGFSIGSPEQIEKRGSHLSIRHPEAYRICKTLIDPAYGNLTVIPDFREPDNIRLGIAPLYTTYLDIYVAVREMVRIVSQKEYLELSNQRENVT